MRVEILLLILGMAMVTFFTRYGCLALFERNGVPNSMERWLKHVPTAILASLIAPALLLPSGTLDISIDNHYLLAGCLTAVAAYKTRSVVVTVALGLGMMFFLKWMGA